MDTDDSKFIPSCSYTGFWVSNSLHYSGSNQTDGQQGAVQSKSIPAKAEQKYFPVKPSIDYIFHLCMAPLCNQTHFR